MPIRPEHRFFYPIDWPQLSEAIRFGRAKGRCERCDRPHGKAVYHLGEGRWYDEERGCWRDGHGRVDRQRLPGPSQRPTETAPSTTLVWLACAHLDQNTANNGDRNLAALCQRCHLDHDRPWNLKKRRITVLLRKVLGDLFTAPYRGY